MKKLLHLVLVLAPLFAYCQNEDQKESVTKMDLFSSATGEIIKFIDYALPDLNLSYGVAQTRVRKMMVGGESKYFLQISSKGKYGTKTASIEYEDLLEVIKAIDALKESLISDQAMNPDYLENQFVTEDGFKLGYYVSKGKISWFIVLEKYGSGNTLFLSDESKIETLLDSAKNKIEELGE